MADEPDPANINVDPANVTVNVTTPTPAAPAAPARALHPATDEQVDAFLNSTISDATPDTPRQDRYNQLVLRNEGPWGAFTRGLGRNLVDLAGLIPGVDLSKTQMGMLSHAPSNNPIAYNVGRFGGPILAAGPAGTGGIAARAASSAGDITPAAVTEMFKGAAVTPEAIAARATAPGTIVTEGAIGGALAAPEHDDSIMSRALGAGMGAATSGILAGLPALSGIQRTIMSKLPEGELGNLISILAAAHFGSIDGLLAYYFLHNRGWGIVNARNFAPVLAAAANAVKSRFPEVLGNLGRAAGAVAAPAIGAGVGAISENVANRVHP